ncbi:MAG TPA: 6-phosphofructokinase [Candidatus Brocadiia bacterium]|nr:ATP-dependent 6-phosphofructokinase [Candidatus Brocadiales bacterium]
MKIGILTGGGDCPGLNAAIRAVVRKSILDYGSDVIGILEGWRGLIEGLTERLDLNKVSGILPKGGTIIGTSRTNPFGKDGKDAPERIIQNVKTFGLDAIIAVGGDDTLTVSHKLYKMGVNVVGVPKTIDNDVAGTDYTFGFDTAINIATEAIDRLHSTAEAHHRVMVVEVMGRHAGWIAIQAGIAGGADLILIPERPVDLDEICNILKKRHERGKTFSIVVVAEGVKVPVEGIGEETLVLQSKELDAFGHLRLGGVGMVLAKILEQRTGFETRFTVLGHTQRGGSPTAFDRIIATRFGIAAAELVHKKDFGKVVVLRGNKILSVDMDEVVGKSKLVDDYWYDLAKVFFG